MNEEDKKDKSEEAQRKANAERAYPLFNADPNCIHDIEALWDGVKCKKCPGWFCY